jgi:hypothetical protein
VEGNGKTATKTLEHGNGHATLTPEDLHRLFGDGYREVEVLRDGSVRERPRDGDVTDEAVTRTLKTGRTWY